MTKRLTGVLLAGALAIGVLTGAAGTLLINETASAGAGAEMMADMPAMAGMEQMHQMMPMANGAQPGAAASVKPSDHAVHHDGADQ
jgi:hypothetical protein